jgi:isocitrate dehydrogenase kinase/phosphatase
VPYPPLDVFRETGYLTFEQLASLRHRGAFSTVSYTFTKCCQLTEVLKNVYTDIDESEDLLREWYQVCDHDIFPRRYTNLPRGQSTAS